VYAVKKNKRPFRSIKDRNILIDEVTIMKKLGESPCVHLVRLIRAWQEDGYFFVQIELAERGTLRDLLTATAASGKTLSESTVWHIAHDVAKGLQHVHNCGIVHLGTLRFSMSSSIIKFCLSSSALTGE
jgi:serine/threonine protein kinase